MPKKFYDTQCCHCLKKFETLTSDHVLPLSWYPNTTPQDLEKWQMPACEECNRNYGKLEEELMLKLGLCVDPFIKESSGIAQKTLNALNSCRGKNEKDKIIRERKKKQIINQMIAPTTIPVSAIVAELSSHKGVAPKNQKGILISSDKIRAIGEKIIRGITWVIDNSYIDEKYKIIIRYFDELSAKPTFDVLNKYGKTYDHGPGLKIIRAIPKENPICGIYYMEIWGQVKILGLVN